MTEPVCPFVDGAWLPAGDRERHDIENPASKSLCGHYVWANGSDAAEAAAAAGRAFADWSRRPVAYRSSVLHDMADNVAGGREIIAREITREMGKPLAEARTEIDGVVACLRFFAGQAAGPGQSIEMPVDRTGRCIEKVPVGPVLIISTWNFPVETIVTYLAPVLAAGCTAVVLANGNTPRSAAAFFEAIAGCGFPKGTVNLLAGDGAGLSPQLITNPSIRHVCYTGSVEVGRVLAAQAGRAIKRTTLELGGNAPAIVLEGTEPEKAAGDMAAKRFWNAGQVCTAPNRIYVHRSLYDRFTEVVADYAAGLVIGDGMAPETDMGPLANERRAAAMNRIAANARQLSARQVVGGKIESNGYFFAPTVFADMPDTAFGMREEVFGPIACLADFDDIEDMIGRANATTFGLSGYVYGPDPAEARAVADRLELGSIAVNQMVTAFIDTPFGGVKDSGLGTVGGSSALDEFLVNRTTAYRV